MNSLADDHTSRSLSDLSASRGLPVWLQSARQFARAVRQRSSVRQPGPPAQLASQVHEHIPPTQSTSIVPSSPIHQLASSRPKFTSLVRSTNPVHKPSSSKQSTAAEAIEQVGQQVNRPLKNAWSPVIADIGRHIRIRSPGDRLVRESCLHAWSAANILTLSIEVHIWTESQKMGLKATQTRPKVM